MAVTLRDIAKRLNLSHATVSFVLNDRRDVAIPETTRQRVLEAAKEMGYRPNRAARALVSGRTLMVGIWVPSVRQPYYAEWLDELSAAARRRDREILYHRADANAPRLKPFDWPVDGVVAVDVADLLSIGPAPEAVPVVSTGAQVDLRHDVVGIDLNAGVREAVSELIGNGARRICYVQDDFSTATEDQVFVTSASAAGVQAERLVGAFSDLSLLRKAVREQLVSRGAADGYLTQTDELAAEVIEELAAAGLEAPRDFSLIGGGSARSTGPAGRELTRLSVPVAELAERAMAQLDRRWDGEKGEPRHEWVAPQLSLGGTSQRVTRLVESA